MLRKFLLRTIAVVAVAAGASAPVVADGPRALSGDMSRAELAQYALRQEFKLLPARPSTEFKFAYDAGDAVYGIDVSHHNEDGKVPIDWDVLTAQKIVFVYAKATQGTSMYDGRFKRTWKALGKLRADGREVYRGAYHFLSATADVEAQARNFLTRMGPLDAMDLPPCVDVEWDMDSDKHDRWQDLKEDEVVAKVSRFIEIVEAATGRKPIIYTARAWWKANIPTSSRFEAYPIWIADYGPRIFSQPNVPIKELKPRVMARHSWRLWQFTEKASVMGGGMVGRVDANLFPGDAAEFRAAFGLAARPAPPPVETPHAEATPPVETAQGDAPIVSTPVSTEPPAKKKLSFFESLLPWKW